MRGQSGRCGIHLGIGDGRRDGCDGHLPSRSRDKQFNEEFKSEFRLPQRECELHLGCDSSESFKGSRRDGDSGILQMTHRGGVLGMEAQKSDVQPQEGCCRSRDGYGLQGP